MRTILALLLLVFSATVSFGKGKVAMRESVSTHVKMSGDLNEEFDLDGPLGSELEAASAQQNSVCAARAIFRKTLYRTRQALEFWLTLDCTIEGQKRTYKPHRIFLDPEKSEQSVQLPMLAKNLKKVRLEFQNLSLSKSK